MPNSVIKLGREVFYNNVNLKTINIGSGLESIGRKAFLGCENLTNINGDTNNKVFKSIDGNLYSVDGDNLYLMQYAIGKTDIKFILPSNVISIREYAFANCKNIIEVITNDKLLYIDDNAFLSCENLTHINIPTNIDTVSDKAFIGCDKLIIT